MPRRTLTAAQRQKLHKTDRPGLYYRLRDGGKKTWLASIGNGKRLSFATRDEAEEALDRIRGARRRGERFVIDRRTTFEALSREWLEGKKTSGRRPLRPSTAKYYEDSLRLVLWPRFGSWLVTAIGPDDIVKLIRDLEREGLHAVDRKRAKRPLGESSVLNHLKPLMGTMALAARRGLIQVSPLALMVDDDRPKRGERKQVHEWSDNELESLYAASVRLAARPDARYDYSPLLRVLGRLGLRIGEALGLQWRDFDYAERTLQIERQWLRSHSYGPCKTAAGKRLIYLPDDMAELLRGLWVTGDHRAPSHPIFASTVGTPLTHRNATRRGFEAARDEAKLPKYLSAHDLRHAAASRLIAAGVDDELVASILGHESSVITRKVYSAVFNRRERAEAVRQALA
jgi:integrase